jgi:serine protease AprX
MKRLSIPGVTGLILSAAVPLSWAGTEKLSPELQHHGSGDVEVIIQYRATPTEAQHSKVTSRGGRVLHSFEHVRAGHYMVPGSALDDLTADPDITWISPNRSLKGMLNVTAATVHSDAVNTQGYTGTGIGVAVIDSGIKDMPEFHSSETRIVYQATFVGGSPVDQFGHGSHVAGIVGSNGKGSVYIGVAPGTNLVNLRALDQKGNGTDVSVIQAIDAAIALKNTYNIRVMNLSLGRPVFEPAALDPLCQAVEAAWKAGIVVVVAAGNDGRLNSQNNYGYGTITAPGNDPYVITVGAMKTNGTTTRTDDLIASYSSKGPTTFDHYVKPDLVAPGNRVVSTMLSGETLNREFASNRVASDYFILSGTSMAAPVVSGAAALLLQKTPSMTPDQVKARLMRTATKTFPASSVAIDPTTGLSYTSYYDVFTVGAGYLDVAAAIADTTTATGFALSPSAVGAVGTGQAILVGVNGQAGSVSTVWGSSVVWGSTTDSAETLSVAINGEP